MSILRFVHFYAHKKKLCVVVVLDILKLILIVSI